MANEQNTSNIDTIVTAKAGLVTDLNSSYISKEQYSYARNAVRNSKEGDLGTIGNEPSTIECFTAPYKIVGTISLPDDNILVFSGDGKSSEIGIASQKDCSYKTLKNLNCLKFSADYPVTGVAKKDFNKGIVATFTDKNNPVRRVELNTITKITNCDDILLWKKIDHPCITVKKGQVGNMPNGSYSVAIAYVIDGEVFSDWYSISNRIQLYNENGSNSLEVKIDKLDKEFGQFSLVVIGNYIDPVTKGATKSAKIVGTYSTKVKSVSITDFINSKYLDIEVSNLIVRKDSWHTAGIISSNSNYLMIGDLVGRKEENYQQKAFQIKVEYVVDQVEEDYYRNDGSDVGFYRDENYDFYIQGVYNTGSLTDKYQIAGRSATSFDRSYVSSADVYEYDTQFKDCDTLTRRERWQIENTAGEMVPYNNEFFCNRRVLGRGVMGYHESTDRYPDNVPVYGELANTSIRYHRMPDECKVPRYTTIGGKRYINILGVKFKNIPKFDNPDIIGYKITRSDRKGGNGTVIARGLMTNMRGYTDPNLGQDILYSNYTVNDLSPDVYLSSTQTAWKRGTETEFNALTQYYNDRFSFYSPHTSFQPLYTLGSEIKIECEEIATVTGQFEKVYKHPQAKLMNQFSFWLAAAVGFIESVLIIAGKGNNTGKTILSFKGVTAGPEFEFDKQFNISSVEDLVGLDVIGYVTAQIKAGAFDQVFSAIKTIITTIAALGIKIPYSIFGGIREADNIFSIIEGFTGTTDYVYQYNAHADFNRNICVKDGNKRRRLKKDALYIPSNIVSIDDKTLNNYFREKSVYLELNKPIAEPLTKDNTRGTISSFGICDNINKKVTSIGSAFYVTSKVPNPNQYGSLGSTEAVSMHSCVFNFTENEFAETPTLYGGDCVITKIQIQKRMQFFNQNMANTNFPNDTEYDYRLYPNIGFPRYWMDTAKYDFSNLLSTNIVNFTRFSRTTAAKYNLDCKKTTDGKSIARIDDAYMYLSNNCVMDFFVESDYNINFREKTEQPFYSKDNTNLSQIFRSDRLEFPEEFNINRVYSDLYTTEIYANQQREDFDPSNPIPIAQPNAIIYSLPSFNLQKVDNWQYFLPANYFSFSEKDFGTLTGIHQLDQDRVMFLFSKASPYISMGRSVLQLSNQTITIGDGGLFAQDPRETMPTDNNYAACNSRYAFSNTHLGRYYPSANQGRIIQFNDSPDDITRQGISYWCKNYMPIFLYNYFPGYPQIENPINGVGYLTAFDSFNETIYITKRDFAPKKEYISDIIWDMSDKSFKYQDLKINLSDNRYFDDISWTLSYSPLEKSFISWHDWHPDWIIQTENHFISIKDNKAWKHNEAYDSFCKFYGKDFPFQIGYLSSSGQQIEIVRNIQYLLEVYKYKNFGRDRFHSLNQNFDKLLVLNTEQISPPLNLVLGNPNPEENQRYPIKSPNDTVSFDIPFFKEENKYSVNMFWDATRDRGEFTNAEIHLYPTDESGYRHVVNPLAIDVLKPEEQRKKFRHYWHQFILTKTISGPYKFICKLLNVKKLVSLK